VKIIAILPAWNEQGKVGIVVRKILLAVPNTIDEILVVNDASTDRTLLEANEAGANVISHEKNMGAGAAIRTGIVYAMKKGYDTCIVMGADDQDDPSEIPKLIKPIANDEYDFVQGSRYLEGQRTVNMPLSRALTTRLYTLLFRLASGFPVTDGSNGFRAFRLEIFQKIDLWKEKGRYDLEPYIFLQAIKKGFRVKEVPVVKSYDREKGYSKMKPVTDWFNTSKPLIREILLFRKG
jgi:dolichol-phosphate mannosyltransferase